MTDDLAVRFWKKVKINTGCWIWNGTRHEDGYGRMNFRGASTGAHRISWEMANGKIPKGLHVLHKCDNPPCVNPTHLFLGTNADNVKDKVRKGRSRLNSNPPHGENHSNSVLKEDDIRRIRSENVLTQKQIGEVYGITQGHVCSIRTFRIWRRVK